LVLFKTQHRDLHSSGTLGYVRVESQKSADLIDTAADFWNPAR